jgi:hypothetical protein
MLFLIRGNGWKTQTRGSQCTCLPDNKCNIKRPNVGSNPALCLRGPEFKSARRADILTEGFLIFLRSNLLFLILPTIAAHIVETTDNLFILWRIDTLLGNARNTRGQQYRSSVFYRPLIDRCYSTHANHILAYVVTSHNNREAVFSAVVRVECL